MQINDERQSIAVIGSGITGLSAAWLLNKKFKITLFEKNSYIGGHTHTHDVQEGEKELSIDSGFIVYNKKNYPNLVGLFNHLNVDTQATDMSFGFSLDEGKLEYSGSGLKGMFAQRGNLFRIQHWRLLKEIVRFNKVAHAALDDVNTNASKSLFSSKGPSLSLGEFLENHNFSKDLRQHYLLPMGAAIWSCPVEIMTSFPAHSFLQFFANHGLIDLKNRPQWRTVVGGSREYVRKMMADMGGHVTIKRAASSVIRKGQEEGIKDSNVEVISEGKSFYFDQVIFACHADEALSLIEKPTINERAILSCFNYQENKTYLHTDERLMPRRKKAWCSWNYLARTNEQTGKDGFKTEQKMTATYWMNRLQKVKADKNYLVTLNPYSEPKKNSIIEVMTYDHPLFDRDAMHAQGRLMEIQGNKNSWFCGSYTGYGFHEDALSSSVAVCEQLGVIAPWNKQKPDNKTTQLFKTISNESQSVDPIGQTETKWPKVARDIVRSTS